MKNPHQISMPSGIQLWLEEQLVARGIDAAVYSKYILNALCNDSEQPVKPKDCRVRILIEELSEKLKGFLETGQPLPNDSTHYLNLEGTQPQSLQEKAVRYSAIPQSSSKSKADYTSFPGSSNLWSGKRAFGSSVGKNRTFSEGNNRDSKLNKNFNWLEENKENNGHNNDVKEKMRSRSTVKQQTPEKVSRNMAKSLDRKDDFNHKSEMSKSRRLYQQSTDLANDDAIQALWTSEKSFDDLTGCDQDLPMDFQQLLESPESTKMSLDFSRCIGGKQQPSFIQCGTNITSSIWSEKAENTMDCSLIGEIANDSNVSLNLSKSMWSMSASQIGTELSQEPSISNFWANSAANVSNNNTWKVVGNVDNKESANVGKWSDIESTSLMLNDVDTFFSSMGSNIQDSLTTLNHNKEDSSFTEVIPKVYNSSFTTAKDVINSEPSVCCDQNASSMKEEDLLISMKTHFKPIKQETVEIIPPTAGARFPDGTTFPISSSFDKLNFHRSPGGGMYLDSDSNNKYLEFNDAESGTTSEFVPKYRVRQNEKFCQTEEILCAPETSYDDLYFPEDEKLVRSMVEKEEIEEENTFWGGEACIKVNGWMATWPATGIWSNEPNVQQIWCGENLWNNTSGPETSNNIKEEEKGGDHYTQLRNEWTQEAEELLSDISQHLCLANYMDTQPPKIVELESTVVVSAVSRDRKRRHWSSQLGDNSPQTPLRGTSLSRPLTL